MARQERSTTTMCNDEDVAQWHGTKRATIRLQSIRGTPETTWHKIGIIHGISSANRWHYGTSQSRDRSISLNLEDWPQALHTLEFTHNNRRHADRQHTPFELMFGESPITIPLSFKNTKYPTVEDKMKTLTRNSCARTGKKSHGW